MLAAGVPSLDADPAAATSYIGYDGSAKFGDLHVFNDDSSGMEWRSADGTPYLRVGGKAPTQAQLEGQSTDVRPFPIASSSYSTTGDYVIDTFRSAEDYRSVKYTLRLDINASARAYINAYDGSSGGPTTNPYPGRVIYLQDRSSTTAHLSLDVYDRNDTKVYTSNSLSISVEAIAEGGIFSPKDPIPPGKIHDDQTQRQLVTLTAPADKVRTQYRVVLTLHLGVSASKGSGGASLTNIINYLPFDTRHPQVFLTRDSAAFFFSRFRYLLLNYANRLMTAVGDIALSGNLSVKGDLTADNADFPGVALCGVVFNKYGTEQRSFGKYKNKTGQSSSVAEYDYNTGSYKVYHSIPHANYMVSCTTYNSDYRDQCNVFDIHPYYFVVKIRNASSKSIQSDFGYIAYQTY